jgi:hypothetical protein
MPEYRLYCLDGLNKITHVEEIIATGDAEAIMQAKAMKKPTKCELWNRGRLVAKIDAAPEKERPKKV